MSEDFNWDEAQALTAYSFDQAAKQSGLTEDARVTLDLEFLATEDADQDAVIRALKMFGYEAEPAEGGLHIEVLDVPFTLNDFWMHEERTSKIALARGYIPDGWGFLEP